MIEVELKSLKPGSYFKRKPDARSEYIREHFNRADSWGPASICCVNADDIGRSIQLKPNTMVFIYG